VVGTHGGGGIGDADALNGAGIIGRHGLALDHGHALHTEDLPGDGGPVAQNSAQRCSVTDFLEQLDAAWASPNLASPASMATPMVAPISMVSRPKSSSMRSSWAMASRIVDAAVAAVGPDRLVFGLFGDEIAVFVVKGARAADDAAAVAAVGG
jgi:hypothetical protein